MQSSRLKQLSKHWIRGIAFFFTLIAWIITEVISGWQAVHAGFWIGAVLISFLVAWLAGELVSLVREQERIEARLNEQEIRSEEAQRRLDSVIYLNHQLVEVEDEKALLDKALDAVTRLTGALATSFVPLDEMGEPLSAIVHGSLPQPILVAWAEHLASHLVRQTCGKCQELHADAGQVCPLLQGPFADAFSVYCLPLQSGIRSYGLLNVYFGPNHKLNDETRKFLENLLTEIGNALQVVRLRGQELAALRQIQFARANRAGLSSTLGELLDNLIKSFDMKEAWLQTRSGGDHFPEIEIIRGSGEWTGHEEVLSFYARVLSEKHVLTSLQTDPKLIGAPLILPDGQVMGAILLSASQPHEIASHQLNVLQTIAAQAALVIESERTRESLEFAIVIQERNRLAREIHDGLAQTLAYLKLQTAQMQRALAQNDLGALKDLVNQNYSALADAYLDARQAIDNLRLTPQKGFSHWLEQAANDFERLSGIPVRQSFGQIPAEIPTEVQAQLIRIVQEVFSNIRKHAQARQAWIVLKEWEGDLVLEVGDDGQGFQADDVPGVTQYGLRGMRERAELIGADFQISSRPGAGTVVYVRLPSKSWETLL